MPLLITPIYILINDLLAAISDSLCQERVSLNLLIYPWLSSVHHLQLSRKDIPNREQSIRSPIGQFNVLVATRCQGWWSGGNFRFCLIASFDWALECLDDLLLRRAVRWQVVAFYRCNLSSLFDSKQKVNYWMFGVLSILLVLAKLCIVAFNDCNHSISRCCIPSCNFPI